MNLPGTSKDQIREVLERMERPIYLLFLLVAGSLWNITEWQGWALMVFSCRPPARKMACGHPLPQACAGRTLARRAAQPVFSPIGALSIAIVVNAQDLYFGAAVSWMVTAVIGGAIVTEVIVQIASRRIPVEEPHLIGTS